jgi:oligoendopeptidase F
VHPFPAALAALSLAAAPALGRTDEAATSRAQLPDRYKWNLAEMYPSDQAFDQARLAFAAKLDGLARRRGHLRDGTRAIADTLTQLGALQNEAQRLGTYAQSRSDEDTREAGPLGMRAEASNLQVKLDAASSWIRPELLALPPARIKAALAAEPRLKDWRVYLQEVLRWKPHTLPADEEKLVSMAGELANAPYETFNILDNADLPYPTVQLSSGESIRLDGSGYERGRVSADRADRVKVFQAFFGAVKGFERTYGTTLYAALRAHAFEQEAHRFGSTLEAALFRDNIPTAVYHQLVKDVNANLGVLHRYLALRKRMMGLDQLGYEDLYPPLVKGVARTFSIDEAQRRTLAAVAPLGAEYQAKLRHGFESGWTDFLPSTGKRGGAYSTGVYGIHPYQLLNFNGRYDDVSTLAHESGHSMHTLLSFEHQPFPTSNYAIFVAEVASTLNENLLLHASLDGAHDDSERLSLLGEHLELLRRTLFRQTMFAEFELAIHERAEKGEALTGEKMSQIYLETVRRYYGHDLGACTVDPLYGVEWAYVPHFYYDFYVYQYATSVIASTALAKAIREEGARGSTATRDRYLAMLASGSSDYPVELLKRAGVDMTTSAPFQAAMADMSQTMDQIEAILARAPGAAAQ